MVFSDRGRSLKIALALIALMALCGAYARLAQQQPNRWALCQQQPDQHDGVALVFPLYTVSAIDSPEQYRIQKVLRDIPVVGSTEGLFVGETLSIRATCGGEDGVAIEESRQHHPLRPAKQLFGAVTLLWALWMTPRWFRWRGGRLTSRG